MRARRLLALAGCLALLAAAPMPGPDRTTVYGEGAKALRIAGATDTELMEPLIRAFVAARPEIAVTYEEITTNNLNRLAEAACQGAGEARDLIVSSAVDAQVKLVNDGCAQAYAAPAAELLPGWAQWRDELFGLTFEPIVIVYNRQLVPPEDVPASRFDLIELLRPADNPYAGRIATYDIEASGVGYMLAFADSEQATTFGRLIEAFGRNGAVATCCFGEIVDGVAKGRYLFAYNMFGSYALARAAVDPRIGIVAPRDYTLVLSRAAFIPRTAPHVAEAQAFLDFALSPEGRAVLAKSSLIVSFTEDGGGVAPSLDGRPNLRPIAFSPVLLVGLDRETRRVFLDQWKSSFSRIATGVPKGFQPD